jgi:cobalt-precorrin 5A hydrolase
MKIYFVSCTVRAHSLALFLEDKWKNKEKNDYEINHIVKCAALSEISVEEPLGEAVGKIFDKADLIVFFTAAGIAVRSIAPYIEHKSKDAAVVVVDECGTYAISLLSGHHGGANDYAHQIAADIGAEPVITTATDREGKFAVDEFAVKNNLVVTDWDAAKRVSAHVLEGGKLVCRAEDDNAGSDTLHLAAKNVYVGIGCRKETDSDTIEAAIEKALDMAGVSKAMLAGIASIDLKAKEPGLLEACRRLNLELMVFSAEELSCVNDSVSKSEFVEKITGVDNVCERSAIAASGGKLILKKQIFGRVTVAVAKKAVDMEDMRRQLERYPEIIIDF